MEEILSRHEVATNLIPKPDKENYRLIPPVNTVVKTLSKILANQIHSTFYWKFEPKELGKKEKERKKRRREGR